MSQPIDNGDRIAQSRERLRLALREMASPSRPPNSPNASAGAFDWLSILHTLPGSGVLLEIFQIWWMKQPLQVAFKLVSHAAQTLLRPLAQRHPYRLVGMAAAVGAVFILVRPWRWISVAALLAGFMPKILSDIAKHRPAPQAAACASPSSQP